LLDVGKVVKSSEEPAMNIAIIGAGNVGRALATTFARAGHAVVVTSRDPEHAGSVATATGATAVASTTEAVDRAEIVVLAVPFSSVPAIAEEIADVVAGKVVVDATNRMSAGADGPEIDTSTSNAEELATMLPRANVIKAFNTLFASNQDDPITDGVRLDGYVAGDDLASKTQVLELVRSIGLEPVDVGPLARARQLEGLAFLNITMNIVNGGAWQSGWKLVAAPATVKTAA
jgi:NADPH-dependent F420 reductase